jgi:uncharacterized protein (DUF952 family)
MIPIYHITSAVQAAAARESGQYIPEGFAREGFIHCSYRHQISGVVSRLFQGRTGLVLLEIDPSKLDCAVINENLEGGSELFPHIYSHLPMSAVVRVLEFPFQ